MILLFRGYDAPGDWISYNGMIRYLLKYYDEIYFESNNQYISELFHDEKRIKLINDTFVNDNDKIYDEISIYIWKTEGKKYDFTKNFFSNLNKIGKFYNIPCEEINILPKLSEEMPQRLLHQYSVYENNSSAFYLSLGLPKEIKFEYFYFERLTKKEEDLFRKLELENKKYITMCFCYPNIIQLNKIKNESNLQVINIHNISNLWDILKVVEESEECHLIENTIALFIYHLQYKNLIKRNKIYLHAYARIEPCRISKEDLSNAFMDMLLKPKLDNWEIVY